MENKNQTAMIKKESGAIIKRPELERIIVAPLTDLFETADNFVVKLDMPGANKNSIDLTVESELLTIRATPFHWLMWIRNCSIVRLDRRII